MINQAGIRVTVLAALAATLVGCGSTSGPSSSGQGSSSASASGSGSPSSGPNGTISEDLIFTGAISGHMTQAHRGETYVCAGGSFAPTQLGGTGQLAIGPIVGTVGSADYAINIVMLNYHGPDTYQVSTGFFSVDPPSDSSGNQVLTSKSGTFVVNHDGRSGTANMQLGGNPGTAQVSGTWRCPPDF